MGSSELYDGNIIPEVAFQERFARRFVEGGFGKLRYVVAFSQPAALEVDARRVIPLLDSGKF